APWRRRVRRSTRPQTPLPRGRKTPSTRPARRWKRPARTCRTRPSDLDAAGRWSVGHLPVGSAFTPSVGQVTPGPMFGDFNVAHLVVWYLVFVFSTTFHEYAHAYLAFRGGDLTAYEGGVLSLDPLPHIQRSPVGMVIVPLISYIQLSWMIGWASVPFDPYWGRRYPRRQAV